MKNAKIGLFILNIITYALRALGRISSLSATMIYKQIKNPLM